MKKKFKSKKLCFKNIIMTMILIATVVIPTQFVVANANQVVNSGGSNTTKWNSDGVQVSKTAQAASTGDEDYFDITLQVKSKKSVKDIMETDSAAVVFVVDLSDSMDNYINPRNSSSGRKVDNAIAAIQYFTKEFSKSSTNYPNNEIGAVGFNTNGHNLVGLTKIGNYQSFNSTLGTRADNIVDTSAKYDGFTNIEAGLKKAQTMLDTSKAKYKYIVFLGDGVPTTYIKSGDNGYRFVTNSTTFDGYNNGITGKAVQGPGANYSDNGAIKARQLAMTLKRSGVTIYSIGVGLQTFWGYQGSDQDTNNTIAYRSYYNYQLNGEQLLINQISRSITKNQQHVENSLGKVTGATGATAWQNNKNAILKKNWEITRNFENYVNGTGTIGRYRDLIDGNYTRTTNDDLFKKWLTYGIGSGYYYDVAKISDFTAAISTVNKTGILDKINSDLDHKRTDVWTTTDPMTKYNTSTSEYIKFEGFLDSAGNVVKQNEISGSHVLNGNNTAKFEETAADPSGTITWNLKSSGYTTETEGSTTVYVYTLKYRVRLKVEKQGFDDTISYDTNGPTSLKYVNIVDGVTSPVKSINYPIPKVKGFLEDLKISKTVQGIVSKKTLNGPYSSFTYRVTFKDSKGNTVGNDFPYDKYKLNSNTPYESGIMKKNNRTITLGYDEYIVIHNLYHDITWTVTEDNHDGFRQSITSVSPNTVTSSGIIATGTTKSAVPSYEVNYLNKVYQLKLYKFDGDSNEDLQGVKFTLYSSLDASGNPINPVTNMNGDKLENITTNTDGIIELGNLSFTSGGSTTYYLKEVDTIDKYNLLDTYIKIVVNKNGITSSYEGHDFDKSKVGVNTVKLSDNVYELDVPNVLGIYLPETGGNGEILYKIVGIMLIIFAFIGYILTDNKYKFIKRKGDNKMKKYIGLMFAFLMSLIMIGNVYAKQTGPYTITINDSESGHTYDVYQILKGDVSISGDTAQNTKVFSNIKWGNGVDHESLTTKTAKAYAEELSGYSSNSTEAIAATKKIAENLTSPIGTATFNSSTNKYTLSVSDSGYYFIRDRAQTIGSKPMGTGYIVKLVDNIDVSPKRSVPTPTKVINEGDGVHASSKYAVGEKVPFILTGTMPTNYDYFETYKFIFHDTLATGLQFNESSVKVFVDDNLVTSGYSIDTSSNDYTFSIVFNNTKTGIKGENNTDISITKDSIIRVEYNATVLSSAVRGTDGNSNKMLIEYSNNPGTNETGKTTEIETKVYIFNLELTKIGSDTNSALANAIFRLERCNKAANSCNKANDNDWNVVRGITYSADSPAGTHTFSGLSAGTYRVTETTTPDGYNTIEPFTFTVTPIYDDDVTALDSVTLDTTSSSEVTALAFDDDKFTTMKTTITNLKGITLPLTGGIGTTIFTILGLTLMIVAIVTFVKTRKENN